MLFVTSKDDVPTLLSPSAKLEVLLDQMDISGALVVMRTGNPAYPLQVQPLNEVQDVGVIVCEEVSGEVIFNSEE